MDHIVYLDAKEKELCKLLDGEKTMIVRGAAGRKLPYGRVQPGDVLWFIENDGGGLVKARAAVKSVFDSQRLTEEESKDLILKRQNALSLTQSQVNRWSAKRYLVFIAVERAQALISFAIDRSQYGNMDDWLPVGQIDSVRI